MNTIQSIRSLARFAPALTILRRRLFEPRSDDDDLRNREIVLNTLLLATIGILGLAVLLLLVSYAALHNTYVLARIAGVASVLLCAIGIFALSRAQYVRLAASLLVGIYFLLATAMTYHWGVDLPVAILLYSLIITLAGILLGAIYSLYAALGVISVLIAIAFASAEGLIKQDRSWASDATTANTIGDIVGFSLVLAVLAVVCWLFNYQMERSLHRSLKAEAALARQKAILEIKVAERTRELQIAQAEKLQQMYRFAEVGQFGTALLHELANHLTTLHLDIEDLQKQNNSGIIDRAKSSMVYLDDMVRQVRDQLHGKAGKHTFTVADEIAKVLDIMHSKALQAHISLTCENKDCKATYYGDPTRFRQLATIFVSNAIDAYKDVPKKAAKREVAVCISCDDKNFTITVSDWGKGIPASKLPHIFEPFYGTKKTGMGLGLFLAKQMAEDYFHGTVDVRSGDGQTVFTITIPKA